MNNAHRDGVLSDDAYELAANVRPSDWCNPQPSGAYNLAVIGAGTAGLVTMKLLLKNYYAWGRSRGRRV